MKRNKFLKTDNVFLDSSIFEEQNFLHSTRIQSLFFYAKTGVIKLHITTLSKLELYNRIDKRIAESKTELHKIEKAFNVQNIRIIKNLNVYEKINLPELSLLTHIAELKGKFEIAFKTANVNLIDTTDLPVTEIVQNYYNLKPPFHNSGKQNEFIDAFILKTLELWCENNGAKMYVLSKDPDFLGYKSDKLIIQSELSNLLENISNYYDQKYKFDRISRTNSLIEKNKIDLESLALELIQEKVNLVSKTNEISNFKVKEIELINQKIIAFRTGIIEIECSFKCSLSFYVFKESEFSEVSPKQTIVEIVVPLFLEVYKNGRVDLKKNVENADYYFTEN